MQILKQAESFAYRVGKAWYHVSPHDLPVGTVLTPGGGGSTSGGGGMGHVWVDPTTRWADMAVAHGHPMHVYEVKPQSNPEPYGGTGDAGWFTPAATIVRRINSPELGWAVS